MEVLRVFVSVSFALAWQGDLPVGLEIVDDQNLDVVAPVGKDGGSHDLACDSVNPV